jgi:hypothetical protein
MRREKYRGEKESMRKRGERKIKGREIINLLYQLFLVYLLFTATHFIVELCQEIKVV